MSELVLYHAYFRAQIHAIFAPDTPFTPQAGTWGLQGIIPIPQRSGDFVFFVTFGQHQGAHIFDEGITTEGVLSWQSQPKQSLRDHQIRQFICHDDLTNTIYLFLRTRTQGSYTYLGQLKYLSHDTDRERPVWFQWQILDWPPPPEVLTRMGFTLQPTLPHTILAHDLPTPALVETSPPLFSSRQGRTTGAFRAREMADHAAREAQNRALVFVGEQLVMAYEQEALQQSQRHDLADKVRHIARVEGDGAGYDILSYTPDGAVKYIEVKTTTGSLDSAFYMTSHEVAFAEQHRSQYYLYRVYECDMQRQTGKLYVRGWQPRYVFSFYSCAVSCEPYVDPSVQCTEGPTRHTRSPEVSKVPRFRQVLPHHPAHCRRNLYPLSCMMLE